MVKRDTDLGIWEGYQPILSCGRYDRHEWDGDPRKPRPERQRQLQAALRDYLHQPGTGRHEHRHDPGLGHRDRRSKLMPSKLAGDSAAANSGAGGGGGGGYGYNGGAGGTGFARIWYLG